MCRSDGEGSFSAYSEALDEHGEGERQKWEKSRRGRHMEEGANAATFHIQQCVKTFCWIPPPRTCAGKRTSGPHARAHTQTFENLPPQVHIIMWLGKRFIRDSILRVWESEDDEYGACSTTQCLGKLDDLLRTKTQRRATTTMRGKRKRASRRRRSVIRIIRMRRART